MLPHLCHVSEAVQNAIGPLLVEIDKAPGSMLGISLSASGTLPRKTVMAIDTVTPASIADRWVQQATPTYIAHRIVLKNRL